VTINDALLWLNDRLGKRIHIALVVDYGDSGTMVLAAAGELAHWSERKGDAEIAIQRDDIAGLYDVGGAMLDLTDVRPLEVDVWPEEWSQLTVRLDEKTKLEIVEQDEERQGR
jgi:hypothetical protein